MISDSIIQLIGTLLGGGLLGSLLTFNVNKKKIEDNKDSNDRNQLIEEFKILLSERKEITDKLILENNRLVDKLQGRIIYLEKEIDELKYKLSNENKDLALLRNQLVLFESSHVDIPLPMWMKDTSGKMIFLNKIYENYFLTPRNYNMNDYLGNTDDAVWEKDIADKFKSHDQKVMRTKSYVREFEFIRDSGGKKVWLEVLKYPRMVNQKVIGISGIVLNTDVDESNVPSKYKK